MSYVRVLNRSERKLSLHYAEEGLDIEWQPQGEHGSVIDLPEEAATYCLAHFGPLLEVITPETKDLTSKPIDREYWVANMSGDPDAWDEKTAMVWNKDLNEGRGARAWGTIKNGNKQPSTFTAWLGRTQEIRKDHVVYTPEGKPQRQPAGSDFNQMVTLPGKRIEIKPYSRVKVTETQHSVLLQRDFEQSEEYSGRIVSSRAPSDFEPTLQGPDSEFWTIDRMRVWLGVVPAADGRKISKASLGLSEKEIIESFKDESETRVALELHRARQDLWIRCFFRCANPNIKIPNRREFDAAFARQARADKRLSA